MVQPDFYPSPVYSKPGAGWCNRTSTGDGQSPALTPQSLRVLTFVHKIAVRKIQVNLIEWCIIF